MYITHYYTENVFAFSRITKYPPNDRERIAKLLSTIDGSACVRFKNFEQYYQKRILTEEWLYKSAKKLNTNINEKSPWYFLLNDDPLFSKGFGPDTKSFKIDLDKIDNKDVTFTIGDSIAIFFSSRIEKSVYDKNTFLYYYFNEYNKIEDVIKELQPQHQYIEAQLWTNKYFQDNKVLSIKFLWKIFLY